MKLLTGLFLALLLIVVFVSQTVAADGENKIATVPVGGLHANPYGVATK